MSRADPNKLCFGLVTGGQHRGHKSSQYYCPKYDVGEVTPYLYELPLNFAGKLKLL